MTHYNSKYKNSSKSPKRKELLKNCNLWKEFGEETDIYDKKEKYP
jgi:hypothetical protein